MKGVKELKARLKSVGNIKKVTSTMELVATAKMKKLQERALATRPYADTIRAMMSRVASFVGDDISPLLARPEKVERECVVLVAGDKGLCGAFNANVIRKAWNYVKDRKAEGIAVDSYTFGRRATGAMKKLKVTSFGFCAERVELVSYREVADVMRLLAGAFVRGEYQQVTLVFTELKGTMSFNPTVETLLPLPVAEKADEESEAELDYILEPSPEMIMSRLIPKSLEMKLYNGVLESLASEFASRRVAMKNATDSASEMITDLTREYNKARQAGITSELLEITAGAEALKG
ncbi:MAG: ATP synthase F1 subunit gamma [Planctomycetes bacterium]|nr:ATP synthase F1 subunit gamma [Planctomycetota bacterium]